MATPQTRHGQQLSQYELLSDISHQIDPLFATVLDEATLKSAHIRRIAKLDVDAGTPQADDSNPLFFAPLLSKVADAIHEYVIHEYAKCRRRWTPDCDFRTGRKTKSWWGLLGEGDICRSAIHEAMARAEWLRWAAGSGYPGDPIHQTAWKRCLMPGYEEKNEDPLPEFNQFDHPDRPVGVPPSYLQQFETIVTFKAKDAGLPHMTAVVANSAVVDDDTVLRGEIAAAVHAIRYQLEHLTGLDHNGPIPVLVCSTQHDCNLRLTQVHFDHAQQSLLLRQSRVLWVGDEEPTADAFLALRWLFGHPVVPSGKPDFNNRSVSRPSPPISDESDESM